LVGRLVGGLCNRNISWSLRGNELRGDFRNLEHLFLSFGTFAAHVIGVGPHVESDASLVEFADVVVGDTVDGMLLGVTVVDIVDSVFFLGSFPSKLIGHIRVGAKLFWEIHDVSDTNVHMNLFSNEVFRFGFFEAVFNVGRLAINCEFSTVSLSALT